MSYRRKKMSSNDNNLPEIEEEYERRLEEELFDEIIQFNSNHSIFIGENPFNQVIEFSAQEDPTQTINRFLQSVSTIDIVDNFFNGLMVRERRMDDRMDDRMMEIAMRESLDQYKTQEKKPGVKLCVDGMLATEEHLDKACSICKSDFELKENITILECDHILHTECIAEWVKYKSECPTCRSKIHTTVT
jgi:hypothetical protein